MGLYRHTVTLNGVPTTIIITRYAGNNGCQTACAAGLQPGLPESPVPTDDLRDNIVDDLRDNQHDNQNHSLNRNTSSEQNKTASLSKRTRHQLQYMSRKHIQYDTTRCYVI